MKCQIPQISWHSRDPVLSVDFQPGDRKVKRLASCGTDSHVLIWFVTYLDNSSVKIECASDLNRHSKSVNVVRFSPDGELLASGDDEGAIFLWQLKDRDGTDNPKDDEDINQEEWFPLKLLRGHLEDIYDISWSPDGNYLVSASMDNTAIVWDMQKYQKLHIFSDSKGYVQGVAWDPLNFFIASIGTDRALRIYNVSTKKPVCRVQRAPWTYTTEKGQSIKARLFYDDTLQSYCRRLCFTPDGELLIVPSGILEREEEKFQNTTYIFSRHAPSKPAIHLPTGDKYTLAVRCNPLLFKLRQHSDESNSENEPIKLSKMIDLPYRIIFAVAACDSILLYDTEQLLPFATVSNIHYTHLTDLAWSPDGQILIASSSDGYCSIISFSETELGEKYVPEEDPITEIGDSNSSEKTGLSVSREDKHAVEIDSVHNKSDGLSDKIVDLGAKTPTNKQKVNSVVVGDSSTVVPHLTDASKSIKKTVLTIKNFFTSPKDNPISSLSKQNMLKNQQESKAVKLPGDSSILKPALKTQLSGMNNEDSLEIVFENTKNDDHPPKCKMQLTFNEGKTESMPVQIDVESGTAVLGFEEASTQSKAVECLVEGDWKLELSQDDEPMEVSEISKPIETISTNKPKESAIPVEKPKRRINFITLSNKASAS